MKTRYFAICMALGLLALVLTGCATPPKTDYTNFRAHRPRSILVLPPMNESTAVVADQAGTIMLAELANGRNMAGNDWPSFCAGPGPIVPGGASEDCIQTTKAPNISSTGNTYGSVSYGLHSQRFNYLFHDGHVGLHRTTETVGRGTLSDPKGMWTMAMGD